MLTMDRESHFKRIIKPRVLQCTNYIIANKATIRDTAKALNICKSTVFIDVTIYLKNLNYNQWLSVKRIIAVNKQQRSYRGGKTTKRLYTRWLED